MQQIFVSLSGKEKKDVHYTDWKKNWRLQFKFNWETGSSGQDTEEHVSETSKKGIHYRQVKDSQLKKYINKKW